MLPRLHLFEFEDQRWFPAVVRRCMTDYLTFARQWHELGATMIGGCCGIGPPFIQALNELRLRERW